MKLSPNEPCHCGTGKKYKKCCMLKDEASALAASRAAAQVPEEKPTAPRQSPSPLPRTPPAPAPPAPPSPEEERYDALMSELDDAELPRLLEITREFIADGSMDGETAFEVLLRISDTAVRNREFEKFEEAVALLQSGAPEAFQEQQAHIAEWRLESALIAGKNDELEALGMVLASHAGERFDLLCRGMRLLECHGKLDLCARIAEAAWPRVEDSDDIMGWAIDQFAEQGMRLVVIERAERDGRKAELDDALRARLEHFGKCDWDFWKAALDYLTGRADRKWTMRDLDFPAVPQPVDPPKPKKKDARREQRQRNLYYLGFEFIGWASREQVLPASLANAGVFRLQEYVLDRADAALGPAVSMMDSMLDPAKVKKMLPHPKPEHVLCPDAPTLDRFLGRLTNPFEPHLTDIAALLAVAPAWLRFLASRGLVEDAVRERSEAAINQASGGLRKALPHIPGMAGILAPPGE